jgi:septal ring factor EnvC (AmiA/AmiB activator)
MLFSKQIADLKTQIEALTAERDGLIASAGTLAEKDAEIARLTAADAEHKAARAQLAADLGEANLKLEKLGAEKAALEKQLADEKANIERTVAERIAAAGVPAISRVDTGGDTKPDATGAGRTATTWARDFSK